METWALTQAETDRLDAFHRRQLKAVIGVRYPDKISTIDLYERIGSAPLSHDLFQARWRMLGHVLLFNDEVPARKAMAYYFNMPEEKAARFQGHPRTTIATTTDQDIKNIQETASKRRGRKKATIAALP
jgi:hypothetical protein